MVVGECNVRPARRNVGRALHKHATFGQCHPPAHEHHCEEFLYVRSIGYVHNPTYNYINNDHY
jgi:hypothetical protein